MERQFSLVTLINLFSLGSAFLVSYACVFLSKDIFLVALNYYYMSHAIAGVFDAMSMYRFETFYARAREQVSGKIVDAAFNGYVSFTCLVVPFAVLEIYLWNFPFVLSAFCRHILSYSKVALPQLRAFQHNAIIVNVWVTIRNSIIIGYIYIFPAPQYFSVFIGFLCIGELLFLFAIMRYKRGKKVSLSLSVGCKMLRSCYKNKMLPSTQAGLSNAFVGGMDRAIISLIMDESAQIIFLKYKMIAQYLAGVFGVFGYEIHLNLIKTKKLAGIMAYLPLVLSLLASGWIGSFLVLSINSIYVFVIVSLLIIIMCSKRLIDGVLTSYFISLRRYEVVVQKNICEFFLTLLSISFSYWIFPHDLDKVFFCYMAASLLAVGVFFRSLFNECVTVETYTTNVMR